MGEVEAGNVLLPVDAKWLNAFKAELRAFPFGRHDDQVDSFSQFVIWQICHWQWTMAEYDKRVRPVARSVFAAELTRAGPNSWGPSAIGSTERSLSALGIKRSKLKLAAA